MKYEKKDIYIQQEWLKQVTDYISCSGHQQLLVAFSGGLDSTVLLDILTLLRDKKQARISQPITLRAIYVHHGLSRYADYWVYHCEQQCKQRNVPFSVLRVKLSDTSDGIEASARKLRYQVLLNSLFPLEVLMTGHHQDDQAETLLLALKRGSGPAGLASMAMDTTFYGHRLLRPLLQCSKEQLTLYAKERKISCIEDTSNSNDRFDRNFIRKYIVQIKQRWPTFCSAVARSARLCAEQETLLDELLIENLTVLTYPDGSLCFTPLLTMSASMRRALLRRWLAYHGTRMPSCSQLAKIWHEVALCRRDAIPQLKISELLLLRRFRNRLYILQVHSLQSLDNISIPWPVDKEHIFLPKDLGLLTRQWVSSKKDVLPECSSTCKVSFIRAPRDNEQVYVRFGSVSGRLHIAGRHRSRKLKKIWQELAVPPWLRRRIPLLYYNNIFIAALGFFVTKESEVAAKKHTYCCQWRIDWVPRKEEEKIAK